MIYDKDDISNNNVLYCRTYNLGIIRSTIKQCELVKPSNLGS